MYLKKIFIKNIGPIDALDYSMPFKDENPKPLIIVGENGTGKSILLSYIVDAIMEFQHKTFPLSGILKTTNTGRSFFKVMGGLNLQIGKNHSFAHLQFKNKDEDLNYVESSREGENIEPEYKEILEKCKLSITEKNDKTFTQSTNLADVFTKNTYCYFPPNRFEMPHWISEHHKKEQNKLTNKTVYSGQLQNPFIVESAAKDVQSWILDVFLDSSVAITHVGGSNYEVTKTPDSKHRSMTLSKCRDNIEAILNKILNKNEKEVSLALNYRNAGSSPIKIVDNENNTIIPSLNNLSTGQSVLLTLFCTILKYSEYDLAKTPDQMSGIVVVDEVDLHLHSALQSVILPQLVKMFPKIQFIFTSHSPLFVLGMEKEFGEDGVEILEMPSGNITTSEKFREFEKAYEHFKKTKMFEKDLQEIIQNQKDQVILFVEGKTDEIILTNAWNKLYENTKMPFFIQNCFDMYGVVNPFKRGSIFEKNYETLFIGMLDFDSAYKEFKSVKDGKNSKNNKQYEDYEKDVKKGLCLKHKNKNGFLFLLPIPDSRECLASEEFADQSKVCIEYLFSDDKITDLLKDQPIIGGSKIKIITKESKKKENFANKTADFGKEDFKNFIPIFDLIEKIIKENISTKSS